MPKRMKRASEEEESPLVELPSTPAANNTLSRVMNTPTRRTRLEEKSHLQHLNKRLEYYIFCQRERDASTSHIREELNSVRNQSKKDIDDLRKLYEGQLTNNVCARDNLSVELTKYKDECSRQARDLNNLRNDLKAALEEKQYLDNQMGDRNEEIRNVTANVMGLEDKNTALDRELSLLKQKLSASEAGLAEARASATENAKLLSEEQLLSRHLKADLSLTERKFQDEIDHYQTELNELNRDRSKVEDELRNEFGAQLKDLLAERQAQFEQEKVELAKDLREAFDAKMSQYIGDFEAMKQDLQDAMAAKSDLEEQAQHMQTRSVELETSREALRSELQILKEQLRKQGTDHKGVVDTMVVRFNELRAMFQAKEEEFNTLMDVKITLAMEIKAYRALLEKEEVRLGYLGSGNVGPRQVDKTEKLLVVAFDLDGTYLRMKNGATENISLDGWKLNSAKTLKEFSFPDTSIKPGESFTMYFGKDATKNSKKDQGISFVVGDIFDTSSDSGFISDNLGRVVNEVGFLTVPK